MKYIRSDAGKLPIVIIIVAVLVLVLSVGAVMFLKKGGKSEKGKEAKKPVVLTSWKLDEFIVNLADLEDPHYLKVNLVLEMQAAEDAKKGGEGEGEGGGGNPEEAKARDSIITVVTRKHFADLLSEEGKDDLKAELKASLNKELEGGKVVNIYFTSFAMQ